jgi:transcriptional regulator with XRE-family HTH domain
VDLGEAIARLRIESGVTQEDLAYEAAVSLGALSRLERGLVDPKWSTVQRVCEALGVPVAEVARIAESR